MYLQYFGLRAAPFSIAPDPQYLYLSDQHREALAHLLYGVGQGGGFVLLTGDVGTGKTTVSRCLLQQLPEQTEVAFIINPLQSPVDMVASVCDELRVPQAAAGASIKHHVDRLTAHLLETHRRGYRTVVIIDEAQNLPVETMEQIRLLTNLETDEAKLLQLVLIGQPELNAKLALPELRQFAQRITARYHLGPLREGETRAYVRHRLAVAGVYEDIFPDWALRRIHEASGGVPRLVNVLCDRVLLGLYSESAKQLRPRHIRNAIREVLPPPPATPLLGRWLPRLRRG
ncbi:MAG: ExeA family protein [Gammaproteobacteria bacterium]